MLVAKHTKLNTAAFVPHLDLLRTICFTLRRARIDIAYSQGFNKHMQIGMGAPLPLGVESTAEYFTAQVSMNPAEFVERFNAVSTKEIQILNAADINNFNVHSAGCFYECCVELCKNAHEIVEKIKSSQNYIYKCIKNEIEKEIDIKPHIINICADGNTVVAKLRLADRGGINAVNFAKSLGIEYVNIKKTALFDQNGVDMDNLLFFL